MMLNIKIDDQENRFVTLVEGKPCYVSFRAINDNVLEYYRTFVPEELRGQGIAAQIVEYALSYAQTHNKHVVPSCSYISSYIEAHPHWAFIVERS